MNYARTRRLRTAGFDGKRQTHQPDLSLSPLDLETVSGIVGVLAEQVAICRLDESSTVLSRARTIAVLASVLLKAIEVGGLEQRLENLEALLKAKHP